MQLSIIIVSWNVKDHLQKCLQSIFEHTYDLTFEVFVVDNASHDGSADMVASMFPQVKLIRNTINCGFGVANNQALQHAQGEYILFLNDDTIFHDNILLTLINKFTQLPDQIGMLGCTLQNVDFTLQSSVRRFPTWFDQTVILLKLHHLWPKLIKRYRCSDFDYTREQPVDQIMGAFMLTRRLLMQRLHGFDENFFVWFEEVDLQKRLQSLGYTVIYTPIVRCMHTQGQSFMQLRRPQAQRLFNRSMRYYFRKHHSLFAYLWICLMQPFSILLSYVAQMV